MAALTIASWTVPASSTKLDVVVTCQGSRLERTVRGQMTLAGTDTYPTAGIPLPTARTLGFVRNVSDFKITGQTADPTTYYLTAVALSSTVGPNTSIGDLQLFVSHDTAGATALPMDEEGADAPGPRTFFFEAHGW